MGRGVEQNRMWGGADVSQGAEAVVAAGERHGGGRIRQGVLRRLHSVDQVGAGEA